MEHLRIVYRADLVREPQLQFEAVVTGRFEEARAVRSAGNPNGATEKRWAGIAHLPIICIPMTQNMAMHKEN